ncbi:ATP-binding cassette domain-containing protein [Mycoplasmopsis verecunda]|uniref:Phosphonate transport system ATP-binding protein n=1 Tax=Mycoplasmopsis verecunda TaxID=171291 RepID=A0A1T4LXW9_9BACT|nr:ATP-binding cassette domain-containing protein [Mycoplasmopsis verecunda]WPB54736.1 ATP-binding cassette domain-containing protein [Mycoplasmopsis verecunda]SJZ59481.1 phosphonate transport system ATP-binding protein [Mycoplasmopsis verecunda]
MLQFKNVSLSYEKKEFLKNINLTFLKGEIVGLIGKSGEGKSTILKSIFNLDILYAGAIYFNEQNISKLNKKQLKNYKNLISYIDADTLTLLNYDGYKNILFNYNGYTNLITRLFKILSKNQIDRLWSLFDYFGVTDLALTPLNMLSSGQKQRFNFISGVFNKSEILLCDEVTSNLDVTSSHKVFDYLTSLKNKKIIIAAIHDIELAMQYCDKLVAIKDGKVMQVFSKEKFSKEELLVYFDE